MVDAPSRPCEKHPARPLIGTRSRCGAFVCVVCCPKVPPTSKSAGVDVQRRGRGRQVVRGAFGVLALTFTSPVEQTGAEVIFALPAPLGLTMLLTRARAWGTASPSSRECLALLTLPLRIAVLFALFAAFTWQMTTRSKEPASSVSSGAEGPPSSP
jgi:hypothetical protein